MHTVRVRPLAVVAALALVCATALHAGDPVPDVDVTVEQNPGASVFVEISNSTQFDRLTLSGPRDFTEALSPEKLPAGWSMTREGRKVVLSGPEISRPVRFRLQARGGTKVLGNKSVDWEVSLAGRSLASKKGVVPRSIPRFEPKNSLQGLVVMPDEVEPGEAIALRALPSAELPAGGRFVLSGVVSEPLESEGDAPIADLLAEATPRRRASLPSEGLFFEAPPGTSCRDLAPLAALVIADTTTQKSYYESRSNTARSNSAKTPDSGTQKSHYESRSNTARANASTIPDTATQKSYYESRSNTAKRAPAVQASPQTVSDVEGGTRSPRTWGVFNLRREPELRHDTAKNVIGILRAFYAVAPSDPNTAAFSIDEKGVKLWQLAPAEGTTGASAHFALRTLDTSPPQATAVSFWGVPFREGCLILPREPDLWDLARAAAQKPRHEPTGRPEKNERPLHVARVPETVAAGTALSLVYLDRFGDVWLDVPAVADTEVVPPRDPEIVPPSPCLRGASRFAQAEDVVCVCGDFPTLRTQTGVWIDERSAGEPVTFSSRSLEFRLPAHATNVGRHVWSGDPAAGYVAGARECRAETQVIQIRGELDANQLFRGDSAPMRLTVVGTDQRVPIRIKNLSPAIIELEGGLDQTIESSGGSPNLVTRSVKGLVRGNFNVEWTLGGERCPCAP